MALSHEGMPVQTGTAGSGAVVKVDELGIRGMVAQELLQIGLWVLTGGEHVAGVNADAEAGVIDGGSPGREVRPVRKHF